MLSGISQPRFRPAWVAVIACIVLTAIFWGNLFRFSPSMIDPVYDGTSEGSLVGRLARAAADGYFKNTDLGSSYDPKTPFTLEGNLERQVELFEHPELIHRRGLEWSPYASHFSLQGYVFAGIDAVNAMPRGSRLPFYHLLASLFTAGVLVWIAGILRARFGWAAFAGFLLPTAIEPMFSALAPSMYWCIGLWFVPIGLAMRLADEDEPRRRAGVIALCFLAFLAKFLCGYEFTSTVILAGATGCLLGVKERPDRFRQVLGKAALVIAIGVLAFAVAASLHALKEDGFAIFLQKAANRMAGDGASLEDQLVFGKFARIGSVLWTYLGGNVVSLTKNFGFVLALIVGYAIMVLLDERFNWFYGAGRERLQILALAVLASFAAPLSWFVLAKGHSFDHLPIDMIMWYVPTIPLGFAMLAVGIVGIAEHLKLKRGDALLSLAVASIPILVVGTAVAIRLIDKRIETAGTWVVKEHANALPIYENASMGIDLRMSNQWFTLQYPCATTPMDWIFQIDADQGGETVNYGFEIYRRQVFAKGETCIAAQPKSGGSITRFQLGEISSKGPIWKRDVIVSRPGTSGPAVKR